MAKQERTRHRYKGRLGRPRRPGENEDYVLHLLLKDLGFDPATARVTPEFKALARRHVPAMLVEGEKSTGRHRVMPPELEELVIIAVEAEKATHPKKSILNICRELSQAEGDLQGKNPFTMRTIFLERVPRKHAQDRRDYVESVRRSTKLKANLDRWRQC